VKCNFQVCRMLWKGGEVLDGASAVLLSIVPSSFVGVFRTECQFTLWWIELYQLAILSSSSSYVNHVERGVSEKYEAQT